MTKPILADAFSKSELRTRILRLLGVTVVLAGLAGCNTMEGLGEDVEEAGEEVQDAAN